MASSNKVRMNNSTGLSLNDRFTAIASRSKTTRRNRSRSRSVVRDIPAVNPVNTTANRRLLLQLERRHKMLAAMRVKRKNLRISTARAGYLKRGSIKALRVGANGKPIKANSLTKVATMNADYIGNSRGRGRPLRRANSASSITNRLGLRSGRGIGGAAERVAKRRLARLRMELGQTRNGGRNNIPADRRSRSRVRVLGNYNPTAPRGRSLSRGRSQSRTRSLSRGRRSQSRGQPQIRGISQNRNRRPVANVNPVRRGRSISRNRGRIPLGSRADLPIKARLGIRPGTNIRGRPRDRSFNGRQNLVTRGRPRDRSVNRRQNLIRGRVDKRNFKAQNNGQRNMLSNGGRMAQARGRSRSRTRRGPGPQQQGLQRQGAGGGLRRRGRSQQRIPNNNGMKNGQQRNQRPQQQRRGRSRSRNGGRNLGKSSKGSVNKDELDKELDQYMATTKTENNMDFLLKN